MAVQHFLRDVWSKSILDQLEVECVLVDSCYRVYEGDVKYAQKVKILGVGEPTVGKYVRGTDITVTPMSDEGQWLEITESNYFAFGVDDVDEAQSQPGLPEEYQRKSVHALAVERDTFVANLIKNVKSENHSTVASLTAEAVLEGIDDAIVALRERNFNEDGVIELTPRAAKLFKNNLITLSTNNPDYIKKNVLGSYDGFTVKMSNNMAKDTSHAYCDIRGKKAIAFAGQLEEVKAVEIEKQFGDLIKGLDVFGAKVIDEDRIQVIKVPLKA